MRRRDGDLRLAGWAPGTVALLLGLPLLLGLFLGGSARADDYEPIWARAFGDDALESVNGVAIDPLGRAVIAGHFAGTIDFGGGAHVSAGSYDVFVAKFNADGSLLWSRTFGSDGYQVAMDVACDPDGSVYVTGYFENSIDFGGSTLVSSGGYDIFVAKLDPYNGSHYWSRGYGSTDSQVGAAIAADANKVYVAGYFRNRVDFGGGPLVSAGSADAFLVQFDNGNGIELWSLGFGDASPQYARGVALHPTGKVAITGSAVGTIDFGGGPLISAGDADVFVAKFNSFGYHEWSDLFGDASYEEGTDIAFRPYYEFLVITGSFYGSISFGGGTLVSAGDLDAFLAELDTIGDHLWSRSCAGTQTVSASGLAVGSYGQVALTGYFEGSADFGGGPLAAGGDVKSSLRPTIRTACTRAARPTGTPPIRRAMTSSSTTRTRSTWAAGSADRSTSATGR
ncbi:MAG: hypothetical protein GF330_03180 [Candidatus Eisenbacteria bacterium]|nr:hypothetical protein [Candidatus Eisenbacteria bacterium]